MVFLFAVVVFCSVVTGSSCTFLGLPWKLGTDESLTTAPASTCGPLFMESMFGQDMPTSDVVIPVSSLLPCEEGSTRTLCLSETCSEEIPLSYSFSTDTGCWVVSTGAEEGETTHVILQGCGSRVHDKFKFSSCDVFDPERKAALCGGVVPTQCYGQLDTSRMRVVATVRRLTIEVDGQGMIEYTSPLHHLNTTHGEVSGTTTLSRDVIAHVDSDHVHVYDDTDPLIAVIAILCIPCLLILIVLVTRDAYDE